MNSETPSPDEKDEITSLVAKSAHELSTRGSLVTRGLQDVRKIQADPSRLAEEAIKFHSLGKFTEAVAACNSALGIDPDFDAVLFQIKGASLAKQGRVLEGLEFIDKALRVDSENALSWYVKSRLLQMANRTEERLECLRRVVGIESSVKGAWKDLGSCLLELGRHEEAVEAFDSGLRQNPSDEDCRLQREIALAKLARGQEVDDSKHGKTPSSPAVIVTLGSWWTEPYQHSPAFSNMKCFNFVCEAKNVLDREQLLGKQLTVFQRSKRTRDVSNSSEATLLESHLPLRLAPKSTIDPVIIELLWPFPARQSDEDCLREMFNDSEEIIATDDEFGTVVLLQAAQADQKHPTEVSFMVVYDSDMGWHAMKEDDMEWELESVDSDGRERRRWLQPCFGPFFSNYDPNEGPIGSGKALAEALAEEKRKLYPNGPAQRGPGSR
jgi:Tetratricopeptide repeat